MTSVAQRPVDGLQSDLTSFVGRRHELAEIRRALGTTRLLTLTGPGGVGKTRLALRAAAAVERSFSDGVCLVELGDLRDPELLADNVAAAMGQPPERLEAFVAGAHMLVVLDNCEHLLDACAALAERLLSASRVLHILATSRQPMGLPSERNVTVSPLNVPGELSRLRPEILDQYDGVTLFVDRAKASLPGFRVTEDSCTLIVQICQKLDGIPLAIELAASRLRVFSLTQLLELIDDRFALLTTGNRAGPVRHQSLRALLDWSHQLCTERERTLWSRLSVFVGGFDLPAAELVCGGDGLDPAAVADGLESLIEKSIVIRTEERGQPRFRMLETVRQYGYDCLTDTDTRTVHGRRHLDWCTQLVEAAEQNSGVVVRDVECANLHAALDFCLGDGDDGDSAVELAAYLCAHHWAYGSLGEGRRWLDLVLHRVERPTSARAKALWLNAWLALLQGDTATARSLLDEAGSIAHAIGDRDAMAYVAQFRGLAALFAGDPESAVSHLTAATDPHLPVNPCGHLALAVNHLIKARCFAGDPSARDAVHSARSSLAGWPPSVMHAYLSWYEAIIEVVNGDRHAAAGPAAEALRFAAQAGERRLTPLCLETIAWSASAGGDHQRAARLLGAAEAARGEVGAKLSGLAHLHPHHDAAIRVTRESLGQDLFESAYRTGARMTTEQAVALGVGKAAEVREPTSTAAAASTALTRREREIAKLVAAGLGNKEIATKLVIAQRTAETHVGRILAKLGFTSRSQIAAWVTEHAAQSAS